MAKYLNVKTLFTVLVTLLSVLQNAGVVETATTPVVAPVASVPCPELLDAGVQ